MELPPISSDPVPAAAPKSNNNTMIIIIVVVLLLLCCCCVGTLLFGWFFGDQLVEMLEDMSAAVRPLLL